MTEIVIQNLKCGGCAATITSQLSKLEFVENVEVNVDSSTVLVNLSDESKLDAVKVKLSSLGYPEINEMNNLGKKTKSFVSCAIGRIST